MKHMIISSIVTGWGSRIGPPCLSFCVWQHSNGWTVSTHSCTLSGHASKIVEYRRGFIIKDCPQNVLSSIYILFTNVSVCLYFSASPAQTVGPIISYNLAARPCHTTIVSSFSYEGVRFCYSKLWQQAYCDSRASPVDELNRNITTIAPSPR